MKQHACHKGKTSTGKEEEPMKGKNKKKVMEIKKKVRKMEKVNTTNHSTKYITLSELKTCKQVLLHFLFYVEIYSN